MIKERIYQLLRDFAKNKRQQIADEVLLNPARTNEAMLQKEVLSALYREFMNLPDEMISFIDIKLNKE